MKTKIKLTKSKIILICLLIIGLFAGGTYALARWNSQNTNIAGNTMCFDIKSSGQHINFSDMTASLTFNESTSAHTTIRFSRQNGCLLYGIGTITANISNATANISTGALKYKIVNSATTTEVANGSITQTGKTVLYTNFDISNSVTYIIYFWLDSNYIDNTYLESYFSGTVEATAVSTNKYGEIAETATQTITNLYNNASKTSVTTAGGESINQATSVGLEQDSFGNIRYYGANPNNYVSFNDELWRIIGVFDVEDENGTTEKRVKIVRNESIGDFAYDNKPSGTGTSTSAYGSNDWTDARLMMLLNPGYETTSSLYAYEGSLYWNRKSGTCYAGESEGTTSCDFTSTGLTTTAQSMIGQAKYYLGGSSTYDGLYADDYYNFERGTTVYSGHATIWTGYVGIMYPSDYAYATDLSVCTKYGFNYDGDTTNCGGTDWLFNGANQWLISPLSSYSSRTFAVEMSGFVDNTTAYDAYVVRPVLYLKSDISISGGEGTSTNPYTLESPPPSAVEKITTIYNNATKTSVTTAGGESVNQATSVGLEQDSFGNIRYYGANPNNYVSFNNELWRIIGVFDVEDENGNTEKRVKIARSSVLPSTYAYNSSSENDWSTASLKTYLNGDYYNSLTTESQTMIGQTKYYLGGSPSDSGLYADDYYNFERGTTVCSGHTTSWIGYIGLIYPSDYAYATDLSVCTKDGFNYYNDNTNCTGKDWLSVSTDYGMWTISPSSTYSGNLFLVYSTGSISIEYAYEASDSIQVQPVLYLSSNVTISVGQGTSTNPYILS